jgi:hypothetical protein
MATVDVRVKSTTPIPWTILPLVLRIETKELCPTIEALAIQCNDLLIEVSPLILQLESLHGKIDRLLERILVFQQELVPIWDDTYNLCGDPTCDGTCMVCEDGEYDGEDDVAEKYCRRGRR